MTTRKATKSTKKNTTSARKKTKPAKSTEKEPVEQPPKNILEEIYKSPDFKSVAVEDTTLQTPHSQFFKFNNGMAIAYFNNSDTTTANAPLRESGTQIEVERPNFRVQFNKLEKEKNIFELTAANSKIRLEFKDLTANKKNPAHRPLSIKDNNTVFWKNIDEKTNITFDIRAERVTQNIVVNKKASQYSYSYILNTENLSLIQESNSNTIQLTDGGRDVFTLAAPSLKDFAGKKIAPQSFDVKEIKKNQIKIAFSFNADEVNVCRFPIEISPEIISERNSIIQYQQFSKANEKDDWKAGLTTSVAKFSKNTTFEKSIVTISKDIVNSLQGKKISRAFIKLQSNSRDALQVGAHLVRIPEKGGFLDITHDFLNSKGDDLKIELKPVHPGLDDIDIKDIRELPDKDFRRPIRPPELTRPDLGHEWVVYPTPINPPDVIVEYFIDDEMMPANESYTFAGGVEGNVTLDNGDMTASFNDISLIKTSLPFKISHTYKWSSEDFGCGRNWRLNLHQSLVKENASANGDAKKNEANYIYTDGNGFQHGFVETYYYYDATGKKVTLKKELVNYDAATETMWYEVSGKKTEVFMEQHTTSGMKLTTRLEDFKGLKYYDQRQKEEKQLEETLASYKKNLREFVIVQKNTGSETYRLSTFFENDELSAENFDSFMSKVSTNLVMQKQEALQLESLYTQQRSCQAQLTANGKQRSLFHDNATTISKHNLMLQNRSLNLQYNNLTTQLRDLMSVWKEDENASFVYKEDNKKEQNETSYAWYKKMTDLYWQFKNLNNEDPYKFKMPHIFERFFYSKDGEHVFYFFGQKYDNDKQRPRFYFSNAANLEDNCTLTQDLISLNFSKTTSFDYKQKTLLREQVDSINQQELDQATQISLIDDTPINDQLDQIQKQLDFITSHNNERISELKKIYKEYFNYAADLVKLRKTIAVASLSSEGMTLCFNVYGQLCALTDSYDNCVNVEYDINNRISRLNDGKKIITFKYNFYGLLTSITDYNGNRVEYTYSGNSTSAMLQSVNLSNRDVISFNYTNNRLTTIASNLDKTKTKLTFDTPVNENAVAPLQSIINYSLVSQIKDNEVTTVSENSALKNNVFSNVSFEYGFHECTITNDNKKKRYFMDDYGCAIGGYGQKPDGTFGAYSYAYADRENNKTFSIHEIDDSIITSKAIIDSKLTILAQELPVHQKEFMFTALIGLSERTTGHIFSTADSLSLGTSLIGHVENQFIGTPLFRERTSPTNSLKIFGPMFTGLMAKITYKDKSTSTFQTPIIERGTGIQICAVPVSLDINKEVSEIELSFVNNTNTTYQCKEIRFAPAEIEHKEFDDFKKIISSESGNEFICSTSTGFRYRKTLKSYEYNEQHQPLKIKTTSIDKYSNNTNATSIVTISKYAYDDKGRQIREETYAENELLTHGCMVDENTYDEKGRILKNQIYNSIESSNRKISEKGYHENDDSVEYELDAIGENKTSYEYDPATNNISSITYPSGSKFTYSRDCNTHAITGISQSTEDGESNSVETHYNCSLITKHTSGTNSITYEYNAKREKTAVYFNNVKKASYTYDKDVSLEAKTINAISFASIPVEKTTVTLHGNNKEKIITEACLDPNKNLVQTSLANNILFRSHYSDKNELLHSVDFITGTNTSSDYDKKNHRLNYIERSSSSKREFNYLKAIKEEYKYDNFGNITEHSINVNNVPIQKYKFEYMNNIAKSLKSIKLPNGLTFIPQNDFLGRSNGKTLANANGEKILGEYIIFRKVGNRTSDMISSIRYGSIQNGKFSISEGVRYKYDASGNITEKWENGKLAAVYAYDSLNRIIREDNVFFQKTWLFSYDTNGNRTTKITLPFTRQRTNEIIYNSDIATEQYAYDGDMLISRNNDAFTYDGYGNPISFKGKTLAWENGKLMSFDNLSFSYDGYGKRIRKGSTYFTYDTGKHIIQMEKDGNDLEFIYDNTGLSGIKYKNQQYILRRNAQSDITHIFTINGNMVARYEYDAWGNHKVLDENDIEIDDPNHIANMNPFRYRGYFYDTETNLYYLVNRYYDPDTGRFISQDQLNYLQPEHVNGLNLFAYCENNPVMRIDENGCSWSSFWKKIKNAFKKVGEFFVKAGLFIAGLVLAAVGFTIALGAGILSLTCTFLQLFAPGNLSLSIGNMLSGIAFQCGMSLGMYGGFMMAASWSEKTYNDMERIGWNPFNTDENKVLQSSRVSFYKGLPVIRTSEDRSANIAGIIWLNSGADSDTVRHEFGHILQAAVLGPVNYLISVGIPSWKEWGEKLGISYHEVPWEDIADVIGGANYGQTHHSANIKHLLMCSLFGPYSHPYSAIGGWL